MSERDDSAEKSHDPTEQKLRKAREKGDLVRSADISTAAAYLGLWTGLTLFGWNAVQRVADALTALLSNAVPISAALLEAPARTGILALAAPVLLPVFGLFAGIASAVLVAILAQRAFAISPDKIKPKLSRISPLSNAKQKFGPSGLFEFAKSLAKLCAIALCLSVFLNRNLPAITQAARLDPWQSSAMLADLMLRMLFLVVLVAAIIALLDYGWQRLDFLRRNRMSHQELKDEIKDSEGDPAMKAMRRSKAQDIALNRMMAAVPKADVVIVNPTHYAVALEWDRTPGSAPRCVAKGVDEIALRIREVAAQARVPICEDPATARALHAEMEIGQQIPYEQFAAVAAAIRFAERMRERARRGV